MKNKYFIGDLEFSSKKKCEDFTRSKINSLGCCRIGKDDQDFIFFYNLLKNHPNFNDKQGSGIDYFYIIQNQMWGKGYATMIKRTDGSNVDFSWVYCCQFKERTVMDQLTAAMRSSISKYAIEFKKRNKLICSICNVKNLEYFKYHVDHLNPPFCKLKDDFLLQNVKPIPTEYTDDGKYNLTIFKDEDADFKNDWIDYHNSNASFQILCDSCNCKKGAS